MGDPGLFRTQSMGTRTYACPGGENTSTGRATTNRAGTGATAAVLLASTTTDCAFIYGMSVSRHVYAPSLLIRFYLCSFLGRTTEIDGRSSNRTDWIERAVFVGLFSTE